MENKILTISIWINFLWWIKWSAIIAINIRDNLHVFIVSVLFLL